jgi:hypothetical protein
MKALVGCGDGKWRSLAARCVRDAEVGGSNPPFPTINDLPQKRSSSDAVVTLCSSRRDAARGISNLDEDDPKVSFVKKLSEEADA